jgi:hypothetical protein
VNSNTSYTTGSVDRERFVQVLDKINLSRHLNDQELLTLVRRFKVGGYCSPSR